MARRYTATQLAEIAEIFRYQRHQNGAQPEDIVEFQYKKGENVRVLKRLRFGRTAAGRPSKKTIECLDEGVECCYDGKYDFQVTALMVKGVPIQEL